MGCRGICHSIRVKSRGYTDNQSYCAVCQEFMYGTFRCKCCSHVMRRRSRAHRANHNGALPRID